jgi:glucose-6-phosphate isomerase
MRFNYKNTSLIDDREISTIGGVLQDYAKHLKKVSKDRNYKYYESSINLPVDEDLIPHVERLRDTLVKKRVKYVFDIGIGGSNLGTKAIYDALYGYFDVIEPGRFPKMVFVDTNDPTNLYKIKALLKGIENPKDVLINVVSKSGNTTETIANLEVILPRGTAYKKRLVITTNFESELWDHALEQKIPVLPIPQKVGGRYSVFSSVGLFPLASADVNVFNLLEGAITMRDACLEPDAKKNPAALSAIIQFLNYRQGKTISDMFLFHPQLESLGKWYRQLMGESIGKDGIGITPTVSIGSADLHSMGQLYLGGPKDKFFTFVTAKKHERHVKIPEHPPFPLVNEDLRGRPVHEIIDAIYEGIKTAYEKDSIPFVEIELSDISELSLGKFMQFKMMEMMYLGKILGVNAFDQPNVEEYKVVTRKILEK